MIRIYYSINSSSSKKAISWLESIGVDISIKKVKDISREDLLHILYLTDRGFEDILKRRTSIKNKLRDLLEEAEEMEFSKGIDFVLRHPELLRVPIIFDENKLLIGFHAENIRKFIPKKRRKIVLGN